jgi:PD-(D/E)XK nuclease superfamily
MNANRPVMNAMPKQTTGCAFTVTNTLGCDASMKMRLRTNCVRPAWSSCSSDDAILTELETAGKFSDIHRARHVDYFRLTGMHLCLLMNFGMPRLEVRRVVLNL